MVSDALTPKVLPVSVLICDPAGYDDEYDDYDNDLIWIIVRLAPLFWILTLALLAASDARVRPMRVLAEICMAGDLNKLVGLCR